MSTSGHRAAAIMWATVPWATDEPGCEAAVHAAVRAQLESVLTGGMDALVDVVVDLAAFACEGIVNEGVPAEADEMFAQLDRLQRLIETGLTAPSVA